MNTATALTIPTPEDLADLGQAIHGDGVAAHLLEVRSLVRAARGLGISPVMCQVALDASAPLPVRERAVARLIRRVAAVADVRRHRDGLSVAQRSA